MSKQRPHNPCPEKEDTAPFSAEENELVAAARADEWALWYGETQNLRFIEEDLDV